MFKIYHKISFEFQPANYHRNLEIPLFFEDYSCTEDGEKSEGKFLGTNNIYKFTHVY